MPREIVGKGLRFSLRHAPCAHICRYCLISGVAQAKRAAVFALPEQLVHRFHDWRQAERRELEIGVFVGPSFDYDIDTLEGCGATARTARHQISESSILGGLRIRRGEELVDWLEERRAVGITGLHTSLAGYGEIHDRWNGRAGDFAVSAHRTGPRRRTRHGAARENVPDIRTPCRFSTVFWTAWMHCRGNSAGGAPARSFTPGSRPGTRTNG